MSLFKIMIHKKSICFPVVIIRKLNFKEKMQQWSKSGLVVERRTLRYEYKEIWPTCEGLWVEYRFHKIDSLREINFVVKLILDKGGGGELRKRRVYSLPFGNEEVLKVACCG